MERLVAWYRVGSSYGAVAALLVANAFPLLGVLFLGWNVWTILTIYWLENGVVGIFNVLKMARVEGPDAAGAAPSGAAKATMIPFFVMHYGMFWVVHGIFVLTLPQFQAFGGEGVGSGSDTGFLSDPLAIAIVLIGLFISHGVSYRLNFIGRGEYRRTTVAKQMGAPYGRLVVLHITILFGGMAIAFSGAPAAAVVVLVVLKTALDLGLHLTEHRAAEGAQGGLATEVGVAR
jgi:hypothetical protein